MAKRALCIGINNYPGTQNDLAGCVNDAEDWAATLQARGFAVATMLDSQATKTNMVKAIEESDRCRGRGRQSDHHLLGPWHVCARHPGRRAGRAGRGAVPL